MNCTKYASGFLRTSCFAFAVQMDEIIQVGLQRIQKTKTTDAIMRETRRATHLTLSNVGVLLISR